MVPSSTTISVAKNYSPYPAGRYRSDGPFNGTVFRDKHLLPLLAKAEQVLVDIDGVALLPSSFWEEVWGGMVRKGRMDQNEVFRRFKVVTTDPELKPYVEMAWRFVKEAQPAH